jgi:hypothetical protein
MVSALAQLKTRADRGPYIELPVGAYTAAKRCIMSTDFGPYALSTPVEGLRQFIACMLDLGITLEEIALMVQTNPEKLLGLE